MDSQPKEISSSSAATYDRVMAIKTQWDVVEAALKTRGYDYVNLIKAAEVDAAHGCGQSDVLYEARVQPAYAHILKNAPVDMRAEVESALKARGYDPQYTPYEAGPGECAMTGIDTECCPCGRHE